MTARLLHRSLSELEAVAASWLSAYKLEDFQSLKLELDCSEIDRLNLLAGRIVTVASEIARRSARSNRPAMLRKLRKYIPAQLAAISFRLTAILGNGPSWGSRKRLRNIGWTLGMISEAVGGSQKKVLLRVSRELVSSARELGFPSDQLEKARFRVVRDFPESAFETPKVEALGDSLYRFRFKNIPSVTSGQAWRELTDVCVHRNGLIHDSCNVYIRDPGLDPANYYYPSNLEYWSACNGVEIRTEHCFGSENKPVLETAVAALSRAPSNWFHWWFEVIAIAYEAGLHLDENIPLLTNANPVGNFSSALRKVSVNPVEVLNQETVRVQHLITSRPPLPTVDSFSPQHKSTVPYYDESRLSSLRERILRDRTMTGSSNTSQRYFLLRRNGTRAIQNQREIAESLSHFGFDIVDIAKYSLEDQISLFQNASTVISAGGAVMTNFLFASRTTRLIQLVAPQNLAFMAPALIAKTAGAEFYSIAGNSRGVTKFSNVLEWQHAPFQIDQQTLITNLSKLI